MQILIDGTPAIKQLGGISEYAYQLLAHLGELDHDNDYTVFSAGFDESKLGALPNLPPNFHERRWRIPQKVLNLLWRTTGQPRLSDWMGKQDLFFAPHFLYPTHNYPRFVVTVHDVLFLDYPEYFLPEDTRYFRERVSFACKQADRIITISEFSKERIVSHGLAGNDKVTVIPMGVELESPAVSSIKQLQDQYKLPNKYLLYIGTIEPRKNILGLLEAYALLRRRGVTQPLVLAGRRGWLGGELEKTIARLELGESVRLLGSFDRADKPALLAGASVFLFPSFAEGFGIPVIEAMALGVPVVTSNCSSLPEVAGDAALLVDPKEPRAIAAAIERILTDKVLQQTLRREGQKRAKLFTWQETAQRTLDVFKEIAV